MPDRQLVTVLISGAQGSGKTRTALILAKALRKAGTSCRVMDEGDGDFTKRAWRRAASGFQPDRGQYDVLIGVAIDPLDLLINVPIELPPRKTGGRHE